MSTHNPLEAMTKLVESAKSGLPVELPALNGLRAIAVTSVMIFHAGHWWFPGGQGVTLFFVLSGFLISWLLLKEERATGSISLRRFYARRSLRIFPAFYTYWILVVSLLLITGREIHWGHVWSTFAYVGNYWLALGLPENGILSHAWSLAIEEQFYLVWPGLFVLLRLPSRRIVGLLVLIVAVWLNRAYHVLALGEGDDYLYYATDTRIDHLLTGCLLAVALSTVRIERVRWLTKRWSVTAALVALVASIAASHQSPILYRMTVGFALEPILLAVLIVQGVVFKPRVLTGKLSDRLGRISYGAYLYQQIGVPAGQQLAPGSNWAIDLVAGVVLSFLAAELSFRLIETPFLRLKARFSSVPTTAGVN